MMNEHLGREKNLPQPLPTLLLQHSHRAAQTLTDILRFKDNDSILPFSAPAEHQARRQEREGEQDMRGRGNMRKFIKKVGGESRKLLLHHFA